MKHIPNILSAFRIVLIPFFVWQLLGGNVLAAGVILLLSGLTDLLDGALARRFGWVSDLGKVLDPIADKLTQAAVSICMIIRLRRYWYFFAILILKDLVMMVLGGWLLKQGVRIEGSKWFGKLATFVFYGVMVVLLLVPGLPSWLTALLLTIVAALMVFAALMYIPDFHRYKQNSQKPLSTKNN